MSEATYKEKFLAHLVVCPFSTVTYLVSMAVIFIRALFILAYSDDQSVVNLIASIIGIYQPWFFLWGFALLSAAYLNCYKYEIELKKKALVRSRLTNNYSEMYK